MAANLILPAGSAAAGSTPADPVTRSLRFDGSSSKLTRTPSSASSATACTISFWVKRGKSDEENTVFHAGTASGDRGHVRFNSNNTLEASCYNGSWFFELKTNAVYRDPSAFYHIFVSIDTTNGTGKLFVNGEEPSLQTNTTNSSSTVLPFGKTIEHQIGQRGFDSAGYHNGLVSDFYFIDGTALSTPVGNLIEDTGYSSHKPKAFDMSSYSGNSFHLEFEDSSDIGSDSTSNSNDWSTTGISSHDVMLDTPTKNYCTLNPLDKHSNISLEQGNLKTSDSVTGGNNYDGIRGTIGLPKTGQWYWECRLSTESYITALGIADGSGDIQGSQNAPSKRNFLGVGSWFRIYNSDTPKHMVNQDGTSGSDWSQASNPSQSGGSIYMVAVDMDNGTAWWGKDGSWFANSSGTTANPASNAGAQATGLNDGTTWFPFSQQGDQTAEAAMAFNFGADNTFAGAVASGQDTSQSEFYFAPPEGFKSLNTSNLDAPSVTPSENFNTVLYSGDDTTDRLIGTVGFRPDLLWLKTRNASASHTVDDSVRGAGKTLFSNSTYQEVEYGTNGVDSFENAGFKVSHSTSNNQFNVSGRNYVAWNWKAHQGGPVTRSHTQTLEVNDLWGNATAWGSTKLEVWEGSIKLADISQPAYNGGSSTTWTIKTNSINKIKVVWDVDSSMDWSAMYAVLKDSSNTTLESWVGSSYSEGDPTPADGSNFYIHSSPDSSDAATTGVVEGPTTVTESYNNAAGFSIITYRGNGSSDGDTQEITHSLGDEPEFIIAKSRSSSSSNGTWNVYHKHAEPSTSYGYGTHGYLRLDANSAASEPYYDILIPKSGSENTIINTVYDSMDSLYTNESGVDYVMYAWAGVEGYSKFGKYTGTGSATSPPFIYTGFEIGWLLTKNIDNGSVHWNLHDAARNPHNVVDERVWPNLPNASDSNYDKFDFYSNGFRPVTGDAGHNETGNTIIYAAFSSSSPFKYANAK